MLKTTKLGTIYEPVGLKHIDSKLISNYFSQVDKDHSEFTLITFDCI